MQEHVANEFVTFSCRHFFSPEKTVLVLDHEAHEDVCEDEKTNPPDAESQVTMKSFMFMEQVRNFCSREKNVQVIIEDFLGLFFFFFSEGEKNQSMIRCISFSMRLSCQEKMFKHDHDSSFFHEENFSGLIFIYLKKN